MVNVFIFSTNLLNKPMGACLSPNTNSEQVHALLITKIYEDVEKTTNRQSFNRESNFYFGVLQPSLNRKGTVKKLVEHLQSHKDKIAACTKYIRSREFKDNTEQLGYFCSILLILQELVKNITTLTHEEELEKKQPLDFLKKPKQDRKLQKKHSLRGDLLGSIRSQSICLSYERSVSSLFQELQGAPMTKEMCLSCMNSLKKFSSFEAFKFDKKTLNHHLKLLLQLSCPKTDTHTFCFLFLSNLRNFLLRGQEESDPEIHYEVLKRTLQIRNRHKELLKNNEQVLATYKEIFSTYETFLKTPQYRSLYKVPLQELNSNPTSPACLFEFEYNNILLYVLLNCLLVHSNAEAEELNDLDNFKISTVIDIKQYRNLCSIQNKSLVFKLLVRYMEYGHAKNEERFIIPFRKLSVCIVANVGISEVDVKSWVPVLQDFFVLIGVSVLSFAKELGRGIHETQNKLSALRLKGALQVLKLLISGRNVLKGQMPSAYELAYGCHFRVSDSNSVNLDIMEVYSKIASLKLPETLEQYGREPYLPIFRFINDFLAIGRFDNEDAESLYGIVTQIGKICLDLSSTDCTRMNYLLTILDRTLWIYNDPDFHIQFKFVFFELLVVLFRIFKFGAVQKNVPNYAKMHQDIRFIYSVSSETNSKEIRKRLKEFEYKALNFSVESIKKSEYFDAAEFGRAKMSLGGQQSTKPEEESCEYFEPRGRKNSVVFSVDIEHTHEQSFASLLHKINGGC